jgi:hypothetical protein
VRNVILTLLVCLFASHPGRLRAQSAVSQPRPIIGVDSSGLRGTVTDPSGAAVPHAVVALQDRNGSPVQKTQSSREGLYSFQNVAAGTYVIRSVAAGFAVFVSQPFAVTAAELATVDVHLPIEMEQIHGDIPISHSDGAAPNDNGEAIVLKGKTPDDVPTGPTKLQQQLRATSGDEMPVLHVAGLSNGSQTPKNTTREGIRGTLTDPSGAVVPHAAVALQRADGSAVQTNQSSREGRYSFTNIAPGTYTIRSVAAGFAVYESQPFTMASTELKIVDIPLQIEIQQVHLDISSDNTDETDPDHNGEAIVLKGKSLDDLPTDPTMLQEQLQAMSGGETPAIYVDGFSNGTLPPKNTIREIRVNQNPFSAKNDTDPNSGMIEILTKPGTDKLHGDLFISGNDSAFNTQNPFTPSQPPYYSTNFNGDVDGPLSKSASYFLNFSRQSAQSNAVIDAEVLDPTAQNQILLRDALPSPSTTTSFSPRIDWQPGTKSTLTFRYSYGDSEQTNGGVGQFNLANQGFNSSTLTQLFQAGNSQIFGAKIVNDTRFQYIRTRINQTPYNTGPTLLVQGAFTDGGNTLGAFHDNRDSYELQNYVSIQAGKHYLTPGIRLRINRDANVSRSGYNGEFLFSTLATYQAAALALNQCEATHPASQCNIAGASQFTVTTGTPAATVNVIDFAAFYQDDWKLRPHFTFSYGLRYEIQNYISDHGDFAPRLGFAWGIAAKKDKPARFTLRGGAGIFYQRLAESTILQAQRQNGISQQQYVVASPVTYPNFPAFGAQSSPTIFRISPSFRSPYNIMSSISLGYSLGSHGRVSVEYDYNRWNHVLLERNINAPLPGTYDPANPTSGVRPYGGTQNINEVESVGIARTNRIAANGEFYTKNDFTIYAYYRYRIRNSDANGGFVSNGYDISADYGRASSDLHHGLWAGIESPLLYKRVSIGTYVDGNSGLPFNITVAQDLNGDSQFNDRPAFATDLTRPSVIVTPYGTFDTNPIAGQKIIPINYGRGPEILMVGAEIRRDFTFGPIVPADPSVPHPAAVAALGKNPYVDRRYNLRLAVEADNVINRVNLASPVGTLGSPLFGRSTSILGDSGAGGNANRVLNLDLLFRF